MKFELLVPGDGHEYRIVWGWVKDIPGYPNPDNSIYLSFDNARFTSYTFQENPSMAYVMEKCTVDPDRANMIRDFINNKFREQKNAKEMENKRRQETPS